MNTLCMVGLSSGEEIWGNARVFIKITQPVFSGLHINTLHDFRSCERGHGSV